MFLQDALAQPWHSQLGELYGEVASVAEARDVVPPYDTFAYRRGRHHVTSGTPAQETLRLAAIDHELADDVLRRDW